MKTVKLPVIPICDVCKKWPAKYDTPINGGAWGYVCEACGAGVGVSPIGSILELAGEQGTENKDKKVRGKDMTTFEDIIMGDADREIECPLCGATRTVEPDAGYTYTCEDCGASVRVPCIM